MVFRLAKPAFFRYTESLHWIASMYIVNDVDVIEATVVGLDLVLALSKVRRCSLKRSFKLLSSDRCKNAFLHLPVVAFRRSPNLRDLLVTAKLSPNITHSNSALLSGSFRCGKNCATCPYIFHGLTNYTFFSIGAAHSINSHITCKTKNLIYMI